MRMRLMPLVSAALVLCVSGPSFTQEWVEFSSQEDRFTCIFPAPPKISDTAWTSEYGAVLPARVYSAAQGQSRYSLTVVDYNPVERLLVEKSWSCPPGTETCQGIGDWGLGYWKNDVRGAIVYATSKFLQRDVKMTHLMWNSQSLVQGQELQLTNNADLSRTFAAVYMHENKLIIMEATAPRGYPPPAVFTQSLGWLDESGRALRYSTMYINAPDVPKPAPRGAAPPNPNDRNDGAGANGGRGGQVR
ncbi:MAG TPA: hypothetical protein VE422_32105 [Terriglobia bacterium]|nr:hypothetical protein [Terriglobia bacterium]